MSSLCRSQFVAKQYRYPALPVDAPAPQPPTLRQLAIAAQTAFGVLKFLVQTLLQKFRKIWTVDDPVLRV